MSEYIYLPYSFQNKTELLKTLFVLSFNKELVLGMDFWIRFGIALTMVSQVCCVDMSSKCIKISV